MVAGREGLGSLAAGAAMGAAGSGTSGFGSGFVQRRQLRRDTAEEGHGPPMLAEGELNRVAVGVGLMDRGQGLFHVLRPALVVGGDREGEEHGESIAESWGLRPI